MKYVQSIYLTVRPIRELLVNYTTWGIFKTYKNLYKNIIHVIKNLKYISVL
jgi:hypothetical protein